MTESVRLDDLDARHRAARLTRAARALGAYSSVEALARAIDEPGLGAGTLRAIEQARRLPTADELRTIATACGLHESFFYAAHAEPDSFPRRLRRIRELRAMTVPDLAAAMAAIDPDVPTPPASAVEAWEAGTSAPDHGHLLMLATVLELPRSMLQVGTTSPYTRQQLDDLRQARARSWSLGIKATHLADLTLSLVVRPGREDTEARLRLEALQSAAIERLRETRAARLAANSLALDINGEEQTLAIAEASGDEAMKREVAQQLLRLHREQVDAELRWEQASAVSGEAAHAVDKEVHDRAFALARRLPLATSHAASFEGLAWRFAEAWRRTIAQAREFVAGLENQVARESESGRSRSDTADRLYEQRYLLDRMVAVLVREPWDAFEDRAAEARYPDAWWLRTSEPARDMAREALAEQLEERATAARRSQRPASPARASRRDRRRRS